MRQIYCEAKSMDSHFLRYSQILQDSWRKIGNDDISSSTSKRAEGFHNGRIQVKQSCF